MKASDGKGLAADGSKTCGQVVCDDMAALDCWLKKPGGFAAHEGFMKVDEPGLACCVDRAAPPDQGFALAAAGLTKVGFVLLGGFTATLVWDAEGLLPTFDGFGLVAWHGLLLPVCFEVGVLTADCVVGGLTIVVWLLTNGLV